MEIIGEYMTKNIFVKKAILGSVDNPYVIGMPEHSNTLVFIPEQGGWCLTDGLGNGWIR